MNGTSVLGVQRRMMQLGRVRLGEKGPKGEPRKRDTFRFTSASRSLLEAVAQVYGGTVSEWEGAPDEGYYQVNTDAKELPIVLPPVFSSEDGSPTTSYSQWYELWTGGGCVRRCDGRTEALSGEPCMCNPDERACDLTTRFSFMLPEIPGLGVWRLDSKGFNAAVELPGTLEVLMMAAANHSFVPAVLRIENRTRKEAGKGTRRFVVPVLDLPDIRIGDLLAAASGQPALGGQVQEASHPPRPVPARPALPPATVPEEAVMADPDDKPGFGEPPTLDTEPGQWAAESDVTRFLDIAATVGEQIGDETLYGRAVDGLASHRAKNDNRVDRAWLAKQTDALLKKAAAT